MNCGFCAEFCPFDAIKLDHDYELASYDRTTAHIHDKERLSKPLSYWREIAPQKSAAEAAIRDHVDELKAWKKEHGRDADMSTAPKLSEDHTKQLYYRGEYY